MMHAAESLAHNVHVKKACKALGIPRASYYYYQKCKKDLACKRVSLTPPLALSEQEQQAVLDILHSERFLDKARMRFMQRCLMKEPTCVLREPCTVFLKSMAKCVKEETSYSDPITRNRSFWQRLLIRYGRGISQNSKDLQSGPISICMSFSISLAVTWLAGWLRTVNRPYWHNGLSLIAVKNKLSSRNNW